VAFLACTAALGGLLFGFDIAIITGAGPFITREFSLSDLGLGWAFSLLLFGCVLGSSVAGRLADRYGRKRILVFVAVLFAFTSVGTALAPSFTAFIAVRFLGGLAVGGVSLLSPMYVAEVAPPSIRGRLGRSTKCQLWLASWCLTVSISSSAIQARTTGDGCFHGRTAVGGVFAARYVCSRIAAIPGHFRQTE
jgi:MFS family permease